MAEGDYINDSYSEEIKQLIEANKLVSSVQILRALLVSGPNGKLKIATGGLDVSKLKMETTLFTSGTHEGKISTVVYKDSNNNIKRTITYTYHDNGVIASATPVDQ